MSKDLTSFQAEGILPYKVIVDEVEMYLSLHKNGANQVFYRDEAGSLRLTCIGYSWLECVVKTAASLYQQNAISQSEHSQIIEKALSLVGYKVNDKRI